MAKSPISVLLADGSATARTRLGRALAVPDFDVVASLSRVQRLMQTCRDLRPQVVVLDPEMEEGRGFDAIRELMAYRPTPVLVLTEGEASFRALSLGALDVLPRSLLHGSEKRLEAELRARLRLLAAVRVITHVGGKRNRLRRRTVAPPNGFPVVGIAASLGGPHALSVVLRQLPRALPAAVLIVQHITEGFTGGLARWLEAETGQPIREAEAGEQVAPGMIRLAPSGFHLGVDDEDRLTLEAGEPIDGFRPSGTALFRALARRYGSRSVGVILTGMGRDGAAGLCELHQAGGSTLAQDEASCAVYGMPRAAVEAGAVDEVSPLEAIAGRIVELVRQRDALWKARAP